MAKVVCKETLPENHFKNHQRRWEKTSQPTAGDDFQGRQSVYVRDTQTKLFLRDRGDSLSPPQEVVDVLKFPSAGILTHNISMNFIWNIWKYEISLSSHKTE